MDLFADDATHAPPSALPPETAQEVVEVLLPQPFDHGFDYRVPTRFAGRVKRGDLVKVNFGPRKAEAKYVLGVVLGEGKGEVAPEKCKPIAHVFHDVPPLSDTLLETIQWLAAYTMAPIGAVLKMALPLNDALFDPPKYTRLSLARHCEGAQRPRQSPSTCTDGDYHVEANASPRNDGAPTLTPKRQKVINALNWQSETNAPPFASKVDLAKAAGVSTSIISGMEKAGMLTASEEILRIFHSPLEGESQNQGKAAGDAVGGGKSIVEHTAPPPNRCDANASCSLTPPQGGSGHPASPTLSPAQAEAATLLGNKLNSGFSVTLLDGVTGSGKTEVYFEVIEQLLIQGAEFRVQSSEESSFCDEHSECAESRKADPALTVFAQQKHAPQDDSQFTRAPSEDSSPNPLVGAVVSSIARSSSAAQGKTQKNSQGYERGQQAESFSARHCEEAQRPRQSPSTCTDGDYHVEATASPRNDDVPLQALVLLPEIALSHQWLKRCEARFGFTPVVWHSGMTKRQRAIALRSIMTGSARLIVGARSALILPYKNLGLIIVDEEHDSSYKQEEGVMYHARDMAVLRAQKEQIPLQLASATPSLETMVNVQRGRYGRVVLPSRFSGNPLPDVSLIDMRSEPLERGKWISPKMREALLATLAKGHQSLLFLNRRGYAPLVLCRSCGTRVECPNCSAWMVLHAGNRPYLQCHHCDTRLPVPKNCHSCGETDSLTPCGPGVERIAEEVMQTIPQARVGILSSDHAEQGEPLQELLAKVENRAIDIIIGTQIIAKGHHFPYLATVGIIDADLGLSGGDFRASERSYQLLHQLSGRAGREHTGGQIYLQSYMPEHPVMQALAAGQRNGLMAMEIQRREAMEMPPFGRLAAIILEGKNETEVRHYATTLAATAPLAEGVTILGPAPAPLLKLRRYFRYRFLIQAAPKVHIQKLIEDWFSQHPTPRGMKRKIDIDPQSFL